MRLRWGLALQGFVMTMNSRVETTAVNKVGAAYNSSELFKTFKSSWDSLAMTGIKP